MIFGSFKFGSSRFGSSKNTWNGEELMIHDDQVTLREETDFTKADKNTTSYTKGSKIGTLYAKASKIATEFITYIGLIYDSSNVYDVDDYYDREPGVYETNYTKPTKILTSYVLNQPLSTDYTKVAKINTQYNISSAIKLSDLVVKLDSLTVTLLGNLDTSNKNSTDYVKPSKTNTIYSVNNKQATEWS